MTMMMMMMMVLMEMMIKVMIRLFGGKAYIYLSCVFVTSSSVDRGLSTLLLDSYLYMGAPIIYMIVPDSA